MAKLRSIIDNGKNEVTRLGHNEMTTVLNGWNFGVKVHARIEGDEIRFTVYKTGGSNNPEGKVIFEEIVEA